MALRRFHQIFQSGCMARSPAALANAAQAMQPDDPDDAIMVALRELPSGRHVAPSVRLLVERLEGGYAGPPRMVTVPAQLIVRESTAGLPQPALTR